MTKDGPVTREVQVDEGTVIIFKCYSKVFDEPVYTWQLKNAQMGGSTPTSFRSPTFEQYQRNVLQERPWMR